MVRTMGLKKNGGKKGGRLVIDPPALIDESDQSAAEEERRIKEVGGSEQSVGVIEKAGKKSGNKKAARRWLGRLEIDQSTAPALNDESEQSAGQKERSSEEVGRLEKDPAPALALNDEREQSVAAEGSEEAGVMERESEGEGSEEDVEEDVEEDLEEESEQSPVWNNDEPNSNDEEGSTSRTETDPHNSTDLEEETTAIKPLRMYFPVTEYKKKIKLATRCFIHEALTTLENLKHPLSTVERKWFEEHPQFKHIFHMPRDRNHKVMGMWMLLLRTACIEKEKEAWFVVNGVPIRYGIKEHALISGLNCRNYEPLNYKDAGSDRFVKKHFNQKTIRHQDVKEKLQEMVPTERSRERLKMAVLFFLSSIIKAQTKSGVDATSVDPFFLRAVDDLNFCRKFPWGRYSFDHMISEIDHTMTHFGGIVKDGALWPVPGFCIPMELLAFEAIPLLGKNFREDNPDADESCPRMCKTRFKKSETTGFPLSKINKQLGRTVDIDSIVGVREEEKSLLARITQKEDDDDKHDIVVASWMKRLGEGNTVFFEEMYNQDVASRLEEEPTAVVNEEIAGNERPENPTYAELVERVNNMEKEMGDQRERIEWLEARVKEQYELGENSKVPENPLDEESTSATNPVNEDAGPAHEEEIDKNKKRGAKRARDYNPSPRVTRSKAIVVENAV